MGSLLAATEVQFSVSNFIPLAVGFFGLGTGYLIWGPQELLDYPARERWSTAASGCGASSCRASASCSPA
jgi:hypothetical protein